ncbi:MAG: hypothetical protein K8U03_02375 [Planctomycetia bacterium]|nr:hypothetical protein [Planctomycetia bacterium]
MRCARFLSAVTLGLLSAWQATAAVAGHEPSKSQHCGIPTPPPVICGTTTTTTPVIRDHRHPVSGPVVRDHRHPETGPIVRDHRNQVSGVPTYVVPTKYVIPPVYIRPSSNASGGVVVTNGSHSGTVVHNPTVPPFGTPTVHTGSGSHLPFPLPFPSLPIKIYLPF